MNKNKVESLIRLFIGILLNGFLYYTVVLLKKWRGYDEMSFLTFISGSLSIIVFFTILPVFWSGSIWHRILGVFLIYLPISTAINVFRTILGDWY